MAERASVLAMTALACIASAANAADFDGLLRSRDLTPFGFLRLDMRPAHAVALEPRTWALEMELGYQNTWALSPEAETYLMEREPAGRHQLDATDVQAIRDLPGENYLVDLESAALDLTFHYRLSKVWSAYLIASGVSYNGGFLDSSIESFHDAFGFHSFGRPAVARNSFNLIYDLKSTQFVSLNRPSRQGFTDPVIGMRYSGARLPAPWQLSVEVATKIAIAGRRDLLSTGRTDYGVQAALQRQGNRHAWYLDVAAVYYAGATFPVPQEAQVIPTVIVGFEYAITGRTNVILQAYGSTSVYSRRETDLDELLNNKYQLSLGVRHRTGHLLWSFGATENLQNLNNTPDIGFQLGVVYFPARFRPPGTAAIAPMFPGGASPGNYGRPAWVRR